MFHHGPISCPPPTGLIAAHRARDERHNPADMLSRLPVMEPIDWQAEPPSTSTCDAAEPEQKRPKRSEDQRALEVFQEVCR